MPRWSDETKERQRQLIQNWKPWNLAAASGRSGRKPRGPATNVEVTYKALSNAVARFCQPDEIEA